MSSIIIQKEDCQNIHKSPPKFKMLPNTKYLVEYRVLPKQPHKFITTTYKPCNNTTTNNTNINANTPLIIASPLQ